MVAPDRADRVVAAAPGRVVPADKAAPAGTAVPADKVVPAGTAALVAAAPDRQVPEPAADIGPAAGIEVAAYRPAGEVPGRAAPDTAVDTVVVRAPAPPALTQSRVRRVFSYSYSHPCP